MAKIFMYGGTQKAGSTWIHYVLKQSGLRASERKEWHYWDRALGMRESAKYGLDVESFLKSISVREFDRRTHLSLSALPAFRSGRCFPGKMFDPRRYVPIASSALDQWVSWMKLWILGDFTPANAVLKPKHWQEIVSRLPNVHIIIGVRNPTMRLWSAIRHYQNNNRFEGVFTTEHALRLATTPGHSDRSFVSETIVTLQSVLPSEQLLVISTDQIALRPNETLYRLGQFVGCSLISAPPQNVGALVAMPRDMKDTLDEYFSEEKNVLENFVGHELLL